MKLGGFFIRGVQSHNAFIFRSNHSEMFFKIGVLKNVTGKQLRWSVFLIKLQVSRLV